MSQEGNTQPHWLKELERANAPYTVENTPLLRLCQGLCNLPSRFNELKSSTKHIHQRMLLLDDAPRHDTVLSDEVLKKVAFNNYHYPMWSAHQRLAHSLTAIDEAFDKVKHVFRGDLKAAYYERLARHRAEAQNLVELFSTLPDDDAVQPFAIRQRSMANLYHEFCEFIDMITPVRRSFKTGELPGDFFTDLMEVDAELYRMRASIARWRDNPSQKLGAKMAGIHARTVKISLDVARLAQNSRFECQEQLGMKFAGRGGPTRVQRWTPPTPHGY